MTQEEQLIVGARLVALEALLEAVAALVLERQHPELPGRTLSLCARNIMALTDLRRETRLLAVEHVALRLGLEPPPEYRA